MADNEEIITLHNAIISALSAKYSSYTVQDYDDISEKTMSFPALLVNFADWDRNTDLNEIGELLINCRFEIYICHKFTDANVKRTIRQFSANLANYINNNTWNNTAQPALVINAEPDELPQIESLEVCKVEFEQEIYITGTG